MTPTGHFWAASGSRVQEAEPGIRTVAVPQCLGCGDDSWRGERTADPLHCAGIDSELFGNDAHARASRSRQGLADSLFECGRRLCSGHFARDSATL
jgi:hypothetical protein